MNTVSFLICQEVDCGAPLTIYEKERQQGDINKYRYCKDCRQRGHPIRTMCFNCPQIFEDVRLSRLFCCHYCKVKNYRKRKNYYPNIGYIKGLSSGIEPNPSVSQAAMLPSTHRKTLRR